jgi:hypothetical protein
MKVIITLLDDEGMVVAEHEADAHQPTQWRPAPGQQLLSGKYETDGRVSYHYEVNGFTYQPHVRSLRPNGYQDEMKPLVQPPFPLSGQPFQLNRPANTQGSFRFTQQGPGLAGAPPSDIRSPRSPGDPQSQR